MKKSALFLACVFTIFSSSTKADVLEIPFNDTSSLSQTLGVEEKDLGHILVGFCTNVLPLTSAVRIVEYKEGDSIGENGNARRLSLKCFHHTIEGFPVEVTIEISSPRLNDVIKQQYKSGNLKLY